MVSGLNKKIENDIKEIRDFINAFDYDDNVDANPEICMEKMTESTGEGFLDQRAKCIKNEYEGNREFAEAIGKASALCVVDECCACPVCKYCNSYINNARNSVNEDSLKMIDLFCGAGGLSLGFTQEGFITSLANDIEECCVDTYAHNHPETPRDHIVLGDIQKIVDNIPELMKYENTDVVVGGPPCQGFSMANRQRIIDDPRN